ncbi:DUF6182 family protein [Streptomyces sp. NPDC101166]|uniref:DUF6182 family protein n=1 Tax=Streptomyces sp. NPDC101166 TaxID=3366120 RepID=UPI00382F1865
MNHPASAPTPEPLRCPCAEREPHQHDDEHIQRRLRELLDARLSVAAGHATTAEVPRAPAVAVLRDLDPSRFAQSVVDFTATLSPGTAAGWLADFTRTVFLVGDPVNLARRLPPSFTSADRRIAWYAPHPGNRHRELSRLLRRVDGTVPTAPPSYTVRGPSGTAQKAASGRLTVATCGLTLPHYLIHLSHTLAEAQLTGALAPGDRVVVDHAPHIDRLPRRASYTRVHTDPLRAGKLRAFATLAQDPQRTKERS